jgi:hypothetical protein
MKRKAPLWIAAIMGALCGAAMANQYVYPERGQSAAKQHKDEVHCSHWARSQSGYDPANPPAAARAEAAPVTGSGARARGAAVGAIGGAIGGNAGAGAAVGALAGGVTRRIRNANAANAQNAAAGQHIADMRADYFRARGACLSARGYSVK